MNLNGFSVIDKVLWSGGEDDFNYYKGRDENETDVVINEVNFRMPTTNISGNEHSSIAYYLALQQTFGQMFVDDIKKVLTVFNANFSDSSFMKSKVKDDLWNEIIKIKDIENT